MSRLFEMDNRYFYDDDGFLISLDQTNFFGFEHRLVEHRLKDLVAVNDPRDNLKFSHWRYDQDPVTFERMMNLVKEIGTYLLRATPLEDIEDSFDNLHQLGEADFRALLEIPE